MRISAAFVALAACSIGMARAEKTFNLSDLPPVVQKAVRDELRGGEIRKITKETENGTVQFEIESMVRGKHRDFNIDTNGKLVAVEEETSIETIPAAARDALLKRVGDGKLGAVEVVTKDGGIFYEASYRRKDGKKLEVTVKPDGADAKD
jgi:uncharacterized membrane protein YkoI